MDDIYQLYRRGDRYDRLYPSAPNGVHPFWLETARRGGGPVLELACGTGRIAIPLAQAGMSVTGLDNSPAMLAEAQRKADAAGVHIQWRRGDMRRFALGERFHTVLLANNTICHMLTRADLETLLAAVRAHLHPAGRFVVEVFVPNFHYLIDPPDARRPFGTYTDPATGVALEVTESYTYDPAAQIKWLCTHFRTIGPDGQELGSEESGELPMRMYFPQELDALFHYNGFAIAAKYGDLEQSPFTAGSINQVFVLERAETRF